KAAAKVCPPADKKTDTSLFAKKIAEGNGYKLITLMLHPSLGNHAVAASVQGSQIIFMDPNGGEATFDDPTSFEMWFGMAYMPEYLKFKFHDYTIEPFPIVVNETTVREHFVPRKKNPKRNCILLQPSQPDDPTPVPTTPVKKNVVPP